MTSEERAERREALSQAYYVLEKYGYNPINQITGYLVTGDETYISTKENARSMIRKFDPDELIEELLTEYFG
ncbi:MAG: IreB family regulatory phosphoprotein [Lachnospiraceae bacterium]|nr:IreB family regulatory phosphoprotein [Lachnospiraceae bacterium]